jgi:ubiquinone/menaquinone biosynthesis C-methylase UbiE
MIQMATRQSDGYGVCARFYDRALEPLNAPLRKAAHRLHPPQPGWVVLDLGCGTGAALADYRDSGCTVLGTDPSAAMLQQARARLGNEADLRQTDGEHIPFEDGCADLVLISLVLHSVSRASAIQILREAARVLAPDGRILVTDFGTDGLRFPRGWMTRGFTTFAEILAGPEHAGHAVAYLRHGGLDPLVRESGLLIENRRPTAGGNIVIAVLRTA